jgi:hypothetical protein
MGRLIRQPSMGRFTVTPLVSPWNNVRFLQVVYGVRSDGTVAKFFLKEFCSSQTYV